MGLRSLLLMMINHLHTYHRITMKRTVLNVIGNINLIKVMFCIQKIPIIISKIIRLDLLPIKIIKRNKICSIQLALPLEIKNKMKIIPVVKEYKERLEKKEIKWRRS